MTKTPRILFIMDPIESLPAKKDTTIGMMMGAVSLGLPIYYTQQEDIYLLEGVFRLPHKRLILNLPVITN